VLNIQNQLSETLPFIKNILNKIPEIGIVLGTGFKSVLELIEIEANIPYCDIPHFVKTTAKNHEGTLILGKIAGRNVAVMNGRFHYYEGYNMKEITYPIRLLKALGVEKLILTNAAGGLCPLFKNGDIMIISDHINFLGDNPLRGPNDEKLGTRFPDMSEVYTKYMSKLAEETALSLSIRTVQGIYIGVMGPSLETPAEYRFFRKIGADAIGMSTVPEAIVAVHSGMKILGFSIISNMCLPDAPDIVDINRIISNVKIGDDKLSKIILELLKNKNF